MTTRVSDTDRIKQLLRAIEAAENSGQPERLVELLAEDVVLMAPDFPVQEGKEDCAAFVIRVLTDLFQHFDRRIAYTSAEIRMLGGHAFDRGRYTFNIVPRSGGDATQGAGSYLFLYSRNHAGDWKLARAIVNQDSGEER
jgi:uncharacterized protein (TIGR02246 family)